MLSLGSAPYHSPVGSEHHELAVEAELDSRPVTASLDGVLEGGEGALGGD